MTSLRDVENPENDLSSEVQEQLTMLSMAGILE
jgi:hypothetical protein